eukprot:12159723-Ditylum_brightwellii.AAC.1
MEQWGNQIDAVILSLFIVNSLTSGHAFDFASMITARGEVSKFGASLGNCNLFTLKSSNNNISDLNEPITTTWENFEESLKSWLDANQIEFVQAQIAAANAGKPAGTSISTLSKLWCISEDLAQGAIDQNTQLCQHNADNVLSHQYTNNDRMLQYERIQSIFYLDTMFALKHKSVHQYTCYQVFVSDKCFVAVHPMKSQSEIKDALH